MSHDVKTFRFNSIFQQSSKKFAHFSRGEFFVALSPVCTQITPFCPYVLDVSRHLGGGTFPFSNVVPALLNQNAYIGQLLLALSIDPCPGKFWMCQNHTHTMGTPLFTN